MVKRIDIKITFKCNNHCVFCVLGDQKRNYSDRTGDEIKAILDSSRNEYGEVIFTGGEPTIRPDIIELVSFARGLGYSIQIQSNGRMFAYKDFCRRMIDAGVSHFAVSVHGHNAKLHDHLTGAKGSFRQTVTGISNLLSLGSSAVTNTVINKTNYKFLPEIAELLVELGVPQYQFSFPHILGSALANKNRILPRKSSVIKYVKKGLDIGIKNKRTVKTEAIPYCLLAGYEDCASEASIPETKVFSNKLTESFDHWRKEEGKLKGPRCKECRYFSRCEGPWREYPWIFGWDEFIPVK